MPDESHANTARQIARHPDSSLVTAVGVLFLIAAVVAFLMGLSGIRSYEIPTDQILAFAISGLCFPMGIVLTAIGSSATKILRQNNDILRLLEKTNATKNGAADE